METITQLLLPVDGTPDTPLVTKKNGEPFLKSHDYNRYCWKDRHGFIDANEPGRQINVTSAGFCRSAVRCNGALALKYWNAGLVSPPPQQYVASALASYAPEQRPDAFVFNLGSHYMVEGEFERFASDLAALTEVLLHGHGSGATDPRYVFYTMSRTWGEKKPEKYQETQSECEVAKLNAQSHAIMGAHGVHVIDSYALTMDPETRNYMSGGVHYLDFVLAPKAAMVFDALELPAAHVHGDEGALERLRQCRLQIHAVLLGGAGAVSAGEEAPPTTPEEKAYTTKLRTHCEESPNAVLPLCTFDPTAWGLADGAVVEYDCHGCEGLPCGADDCAYGVAHRMKIAPGAKFAQLQCPSWQGATCVEEDSIA